MTAAFSEEALFAKSRIFMERGLSARDDGDFELFHTWAALALELLGKSELSRVHPALVADPTRFSSLLAACGGRKTDDVRSVTAKTVYERLRLLSPQYDRRAEDFCMLMANRRNEELHSGSSPTTDLTPDAWVPEFWRVAQLILSMGDKSLKAWVGDAEAESAERLIADKSRVLEEAVLARIRRFSEDFERNYPKGSAERSQVLEASRQLILPLGCRSERVEYDSFEKHDCPACDCVGWLFGHELEEHREPPEYDEDGGWIQWVDTHYASEAFACPTCGLRLSGQQELSVGELPETFVTTDVAEPDYEEEYGND